MKLFDSNDWKYWFAKLKWQLISFKFLSFWTFIILSISAWRSLQAMHLRTISIAGDFYQKGYLTKDNLANIIIHSTTVFYDSALGHLLIFAGAIFASIITLKGVSYFTNAKKTTEVLRKLPSDQNLEDLKRYLPKGGE